MPRRTCAGTRPSALARHGSREGAGVIRQMLDRQYVEHVVKRDVRQDDDQDPIADVMISGLRAAAALKDEALRASITAPESAGPQHEGPAGGARGIESDWVVNCALVISLADDTNF